MLEAEREGFEPSVPVRVQRFSRPSRSTTPASFPVVLIATAKLQIIFYIWSFFRDFFNLNFHLVFNPAFLACEC